MLSRRTLIATASAALIVPVQAQKVQARLVAPQWNDPDLLNQVLTAKQNGTSIAIAQPTKNKLPAPTKVKNLNGLYNYQGHGASWPEVDRVKEILKTAIGVNAGNVFCSFTIWHLYAIISKMASVETGNTFIDLLNESDYSLNFISANNIQCFITSVPVIEFAMNEKANLSSLKKVIVLDRPYTITTKLINDLAPIKLVSIENFCLDWKLSGQNRVEP